MCRDCNFSSVNGWKKMQGETRMIRPVSDVTSQKLHKKAGTADISLRKYIIECPY